MQYVTIPDVEIAHVGMNWPASSGSVTLTLQHLADACDAAMNDPHILLPRAKVGHTDPRFNESPPVHDPFAYHGALREDGNPAYGRFANLRRTNDGASLRGDWIDVPEWLAAAAPSAYPTRSLEGDWDVETPGGKRYSFVLTAVAVGGEWLPAISCLEDLEALLTDGPDAVIAVQAARRDPVHAARRPDMPVNATADTDAVIHIFWNDFAQGDRYWWWPVSVWVDPNQVIADDDEGHLYRVPFTTDQDGNVTFADPVRVVTQYRDIPVTDAQPAVAAARPQCVFASARDVRPADRVRAAADTNERSDVDTSTLREQLDLPDATDDEVIAAAAERLSLVPPAAEEPEPAAAAEPVAAPVAASVDPEALAQLQEDARLGREAREQQIAAERNLIVDDAVRGGYITSASRASHLAELSRGGEIEQRHREYLASLSVAIVPVEQRGTVPAVDAATDEGRRTRVRAALGITKEAK